MEASNPMSHNRLSVSPENKVKKNNLKVGFIQYHKRDCELIGGSRVTSLVAFDFWPQIFGKLAEI